MKYSRDLIIKRAFDVFLNRGYDSASISVLQTELGMSRGAMYRYFKTKEELFIAVVDEYFFRIYWKIVKYFDASSTVAECIERLYRRHRLYAIVFDKAGINRTIFLNYTAFLIQAAKNYPDFKKYFLQLHFDLKECWRKALLNSIKQGEVKEDIDVDILSSLFINTMLKESLNYDDKLDSEYIKTYWLSELEGRKKVTDYLYTLIKK